MVSTITIRLSALCAYMTIPAICYYNFYLPSKYKIQITEVTTESPGGAGDGGQGFGAHSAPRSQIQELMMRGETA